jgi:ABC-type spermidine/putrescine transport system permease subunit II
VVCIAGLRRFDRTLEMAAASLGASPATVLRTVTLPLLLPSLVSAGLFAFIVGFDDVVFGLFLSGATSTPLPIRMWDDIRLEISPQIAVVAVLLFAMLAVGYGLILAIKALSGSYTNARSE